MNTELSEWHERLQLLLDSKMEPTAAMQRWWLVTVLVGFLAACHEAVEAEDRSSLEWWCDLERVQKLASFLYADTDPELNGWQGSCLIVLASAALRLLEYPDEAPADFIAFLRAIFLEQPSSLGEMAARLMNQLPDAYYQDMRRQLLHARPASQNNPRIEKFPVIPKRGKGGIIVLIRAEISEVSGWAIFPDPAQSPLYLMDEQFLSIYSDCTSATKPALEVAGLSDEQAIRIRLDLYRRSEDAVPLIRALRLKGRSGGGALARVILNIEVGNALDPSEELTSMVITSKGLVRKVTHLEEKWVVFLNAAQAVTRAVFFLSVEDHRSMIMNSSQATNATIQAVASVKDLISRRKLTFFFPSPAAPPAYFSWRDTAYDRAQTALMGDQNRIVLISGPRGAGKSALWRQIAAHVHTDRFQVGIVLDMQEMNPVDPNASDYWWRMLGSYLYEAETSKEEISAPVPGGTPDERTRFSAEDGQGEENLFAHLKRRYSPTGPRLLLAIENLEMAMDAAGELLDPRLERLLQAVRRDDLGLHIVLVSKVQPDTLAAMSHLVLVDNMEEQDAIALLRAMDRECGNLLGNISDELLRPLYQRSDGNPRTLQSFAARLAGDPGSPIQTVKRLAEAPLLASLNPAMQEDWYILDHYLELSQTKQILALTVAALRSEKREVDVLKVARAAFATLGITPPENLTTPLREMARAYICEMNEDGLYSLNAQYLDVLTSLLNRASIAPPNTIVSPDWQQALYGAAAEHYSADLNSAYDNAEAITRYFKFEDEAYLASGANWVRCLSYQSKIEDTLVALRFIAMYLNAFDWEGMVVPYKPCREYLQIWQRTEIHRREERHRQGKPGMQGRTLLALLQEFENRYPREPERVHPALTYPLASSKRAHAAMLQRWDSVVRILEEIQSRYDLPEDWEPTPLNDETLDDNAREVILMRIRILSYICHYKGQACIALQSLQPTEETESEDTTGILVSETERPLALYQRSNALTLLEEPTMIYLVYYRYPEMADYARLQGRNSDALALILTGVRACIKVENLADREMMARQIQVFGDLLWDQGEWKAAFLWWCWALYQEFIYLYYGQPYFCDEYSCVMYRMWAEMLTGRLLMLARGDVPAREGEEQAFLSEQEALAAALQEALDLRKFFALCLPQVPSSEDLADLLRAEDGIRPSFFGRLWPEMPTIDADHPVKAPEDDTERDPMVPEMVRLLKAKQDQGWPQSRKDLLQRLKRPLPVQQHSSQ